MNKNSHERVKCSINLKRVLDEFIMHPLKSVTIKNLLYERGLRRLTNEKRVRKDAIKPLVKMKILKGVKPWGAPEKAKKKAKKDAVSKEHLYILLRTKHAFKTILGIYLTADVKKLLTSQYTNTIIEKIGFKQVYEVIQSSHPNFKELPSEALFHHKATIEEYKLIAEELKKEIFTFHEVTGDDHELKPHAIDIKEHMRNLTKEVTRKPIEHIHLLSNFDPLHAVRFYRETINKPLTDAYNELAKKSTITKGLADFLAFDNYLSPLTAHPMNSVKRVLFSKPFERIYEDAYLLDGEAFELLSGRAAAIYNSFSDFLYEYFKNDSYGKVDRKMITKEMIYSWNVASTRFDIVCSILAELYKKKNGSGNYHLWSDDLSYNITDLKSGKSLLSPDIASSLLMFGSTPLTIKPDPKNSKRMVGEIMRKPFTVLRPCYTFKDMEWRSDNITFDVIFKDLEQKMED
jgi:hypothetical protein